MPATNPEIGKTVGDYEIIAVLGQGGMGKVFKQIQDAQANAAKEPAKRRRKRA